jgi:hypothetical protein
MSESTDVCPGCEHSLSRHFRDVTGVVRCLVTHSGVSDRGVIGIPWRTECDCAGGKSKSTDERRTHEAREKAERDAWMEELAASIRADMEKHNPAVEPTHTEP